MSNDQTPDNTMDQYHTTKRRNNRVNKKFVLIITDSRGSWLHYRLRQYQNRTIKFRVIYKRGAGLKMLWEIAEWAILTRPVDLIILLGGVCDMTSKIYIGESRFYWPLDDMDKTFTDISTITKDIARNYRMIAPACKFVFLPDPGADLIRLNRIPHPVPWRELVVQQELEEHLELLHLYTRALNSYMGSLTPWSLDVSHAHRNGNLRPVYDRFYDGIHFSSEQVSKLASEINRYSREALKLVCLLSHFIEFAIYVIVESCSEFWLNNLLKVNLNQPNLSKNLCLISPFSQRLVISSVRHFSSEDRYHDANQPPPILVTSSDCHDSSLNLNLYFYTGVFKKRTLDTQKITSSGCLEIIDSLYTKLMEVSSDFLAEIINKGLSIHTLMFFLFDCLGLMYTCCNILIILCSNYSLCTMNLDCLIELKTNTCICTSVINSTCLIL